MKSDDETPWQCQLLWPWFGPPCYAEIEDPDAWLDAIRRQFAWRGGEPAGDDRPGGGYLAKAGRLTVTRRQAEEIIRHEHGPADIRRRGRWRPGSECSPPEGMPH